MMEFLSAVGYTKTVHTLVDYYQYIKAVEYLICVAFFVSFPMFYKYLNKPQAATQEASR
ncbi:MAG: hypothetical protein PHH28_04475 [Desulfuromonadaceae bacterium]|nr:hypothetical protein [Desulfuromonadaceae bacterium]